MSLRIGLFSLVGLVGSLLSVSPDASAQAGKKTWAIVVHGGNGGVIVVSSTGDIAMPYNTAGMARGCADASGRFEYGIGKELKSAK